MNSILIGEEMSIFTWKAKNYQAPSHLLGVAINIEIANIVKELLYGSSSVIRVNSLAGNGKTTLLKILSKYYLARLDAEYYLSSFKKDDKILCLAYSQRLKDEFVSIMDPRISSKPLIELKKYSHRYKDYDTSCNPNKYTPEIIQKYFNVDYSLAYDISKVISIWLRSYMSEENMSSFAYGINTSSEAATFAHTYVTDTKCFAKGTFITDEFLIKEIQLQFIQKTTFSKEDEIDLLLVDEGQDLSDAALSIFLNFPAKKKVIVGDSNQKIYPFVSSKNALLKKFGNSVEYTLSYSYRHSQEIATRANKILKMFKNSEAQIIPQQNKKLKDVRKSGYLYRWKNEVLDALKIAKKRNIGNIEISEEAIYFLNFMDDLYQYENKENDLSFETSTIKYTKQKKDEFCKKMGYELTLVEFIKSYLPQELNKGKWAQAKRAFKNYNLEEFTNLIHYYHDNKHNGRQLPTLTITSIYKSKGFEFSEITILPSMRDLAIMVAEYFIKTQQTIKKGAKFNYIKEFANQVHTKEQFYDDNIAKWIYELNLYYVAITRARDTLEDLSKNALYVDENSINEVIFKEIERFKRKSKNSSHRLRLLALNI